MQPSVIIESVRPIKADLASQEISLEVNDDRETKSICVQEIKKEKFANEYLGHIDSGPASLDNSQTEVSNNDGKNTLNNDMETKSVCVQDIKEQKLDNKYPCHIDNGQASISINQTADSNKDCANVTIYSNEKDLIKAYRDPDNVRIKLENNVTEAAANFRGDGHGNEMIDIKEEPLDHENAGSLLTSDKESFLFRHQPIKIEPPDS